MLAPLNSTMIAVALPQLMGAFGVSLTSVGWLVTAYLIAMASLQPIAGKLGDRLGRRRLILGGLVYFGIASIGAATAFSFWSLLFFRVQQALSVAIVLPNGIALVREVVPARPSCKSLWSDLLCYGPGCSRRAAARWIPG